MLNDVLLHLEEIVKWYSASFGREISITVILPGPWRVENDDVI
jgi:hypothetical protein